jgi:stage II sporulation protein D
MRVKLAVLALLAVLVPAGSAALPRSPDPKAASTAGPTFAISGRGWGHGVGMSQWGALGFAQHGYGYAQILSHYYPGTTLGRAPVSRVRVLLVDGKRSLTVASDSPLRVRDVDGTVHELAPGSHTLGPALKLKPVGAQQPKPLTGPLHFTAQPGPLRLDGKPYRGSLEVSVSTGKLRAINYVGLEPYLYGVVPDEVPDDWPAEALRAQSVVARSYALAVRKAGDFDLFDDVRSQVYNGIDAEEASTTAAVAATAGQVLLYAGKVATTFFFSTSGGRTAAIADVWNAPPTPYLVSVPDPYDSISPVHRWGPLPFTAAKLRKTLGVKGSLLDVRTTQNASGRVDEVIGVGSDGETSISAAAMRERLGLRSTWFTVGMLALDPQAKPVVYGSRGQVTGRARGLAGVTLEQRVSGSVWEKAAAVKPGQEGAFTVAVKPLTSTEYRLASGTLRSSPLRVAVAPFVRLAPPLTTTSLGGTTRPPLPGATVAIQRQEASVWRTATRAEVDDQGAFEAQLELLPGLYRARIAPGRGFAPGVSAVLNVVPA